MAAAEAVATRNSIGRVEVRTAAVLVRGTSCHPPTSARWPKVGQLAEDLSVRQAGVYEFVEPTSEGIGSHNTFLLCGKIWVCRQLSFCPPRAGLGDPPVVGLLRVLKIPMTTAAASFVERQGFARSGCGCKPEH